MRKFTSKFVRACAIAAALPLMATAACANQASDYDAVETFFAWWDEAFKVPGSFTPENFGKYLAPDAKLIMNGQVAIDGLENWATHFQKIQASGAEVELVVPFKHKFQAGNELYTRHIIRSRRNGEPTCLIVSGHSLVQDGLIKSIDIVRTPIDPATDELCWK